ncbi:hypothetical protein F2Q68_00035434 [Brassica cretica]|uniref:Uncharacterized protein n=1 Tax=Brassica cretica TaxID=69181 RepID=A0A8S9HBK4_BRACR|nr:hypothetical protein F2Q68_00035434 [Brassica cretica]
MHGFSISEELRPSPLLLAAVILPNQFSCFTPHWNSNLHTLTPTSAKAIAQYRDSNTTRN